MGRGPGTLTGGRGPRSTGVVSGFVLKLARQSAGLTQERLAEALAVDATTVQGWESGRRPLAATSAGDFLRLTTRLSRLGAPPSTRRRLTEAVEADQVLSTGITAGSAVVDVDTHPLAASVHRRTITNLITWPITNRLPQQLQEFTPKVPRRGPVASHPVLPVEERTRFFDHLLTVVQRGTRADEALLRRQAVYLLGFDGREHVADWLRDEWRRAARLNYWAHWIGELSDEQTSDEFMLNEDTRTWTGVRLLHHLTNRLEPDAPHLPLNLHTLHALIASRSSLLSERSEVRRRVGERLDELASSGGLSHSGRDQVSGLQYALRIAGR